MSPYKRLCNEIDSQILNDGKYTQDGYSLDYNDLDECDQQAIVALFLDYDDRDLFSVYENEKVDDVVSSLIGMLKKDTHESNEDFVNCLKKNLREYYATRAQELIDERCVELTSDDDFEHGMTRRVDRNTGESHLVHI
jgi:hypothetical protein